MNDGVTISQQRSEEAMIVLPGKTRRTGFVVAYHELGSCYGRAIGLDGIGLWFWLAAHRNRTLPELRGRAWPGVRLTQATFGIGNAGTVKRLAERLENAGLLQIRRAGDLFTGEELRGVAALLRVPGKRGGSKLGPQSHVYLVSDPLTADEVPSTRPDLCEGCKSRCPRASASKSEAVAASKSEADRPVSASKSEAKQDWTDSNNTAGELLLLARKVTKTKARQAAKAHSFDRIQSVVTWAESQNAANPAGLIVKALDEGWEIEQAAHQQPAAVDADLISAALQRAEGK